MKVKADGLEEQTVQITTEASSDGTTEAKAISSVKMSKNYYVKVGNRPQLPAELDAVLNDKSEAKGKVTWEDVAEDQINQSVHSV